MENSKTGSGDSFRDRREEDTVCRIFRYSNSPAIPGLCPKRGAEDESRTQLPMTLSLFLGSMLLGLSVAAPIGPINVEIIRRGLTQSSLAAFAMGCGAVSADCIYFSLALAGARQVSAMSDSEGWRVFGLGLGAAMLIWLGVNSIRKVRAIQEPVPRDRSKDTGVDTIQSDDHCAMGIHRRGVCGRRGGSRDATGAARRRFYRSTELGVFRDGPDGLGAPVDHPGADASDQLFLGIGSSRLRASIRARHLRNLKSLMGCSDGLRGYPSVWRTRSCSCLRAARSRFQMTMR